MKIFITGIAGMIGYHTANYFMKRGHTVVGVDNFNDYYDKSLKYDRVRMLNNDFKNVDFEKFDIVTDSFSSETIKNKLKDADVVLHLAAYANPRHAMEEPQTYIDTNITGTQKLIEACEDNGINNVVYASSSCVMHGQPLPWKESDKPGHQNNPYGWSKRANECQFLHSNINKTIGLRFFTVYGPWGRPDMALFKFTENIMNGDPIDIYNYGDMKRDFTYVDDIVQGIDIVVKNILSNDDSTGEIYNIGYGDQINLLEFVDEIEKNTGRKAIRNLLPAHPGDTPETWADTTKLRALGYKPETSVKEGIAKFVNWYKRYYGYN